MFAESAEQSVNRRWCGSHAGWQRADDMSLAARPRPTSCTRIRWFTRLMLVP